MSMTAAKTSVPAEVASGFEPDLDRNFGTVATPAVQLAERARRPGRRSSHEAAA
jgi:hypothetical protein